MRQTSRSKLKGLCLAACAAFFSVSISVGAAEYSPNFKNTEISEFINIVGKNLEKTIIRNSNNISRNMMNLSKKKSAN